MNKNSKHICVHKQTLDNFLKTSWFHSLDKDWDIWREQTHIKDRIVVMEDDPESPYGDKIDVTPYHKVSALKFKLRCVTHGSFDFCIYEDYESKELVYFKPAIYYYGNYIKEYACMLLDGVKFDTSFYDYCRKLADSGDKFAMHNYKIDMETVEKFNLMK